MHFTQEIFFPIESLVSNFEDGLGAGDAMLATSSLALIVSKNIVISSILGNLAAAIVCENKGNKPIEYNFLLKRIKEISKLKF